MTDILAASEFLAPTDGTANLADFQTRRDFFESKKEAKSFIKTQGKAISQLTHQLYGEASRSLIVLLQGMDTSGKDGTTSALFKYTPPLNVNVASFKAPSKHELSHDYLWRIHNVCPSKGQITVFNRSHYEDVLVVKVREFASADKVEQRYDQINNFEKHLTENGTTVLKFMLNISKETQGERLRDRLIVPGKRWKFNPGDLDDRALWPDFMEAYDVMLKRTSSDHAPWYVIPSDSRPNRNALIAQIVRQKLEEMNPQYPDPGYRPSDFNIE